jgi:hypothetical protein
MTQQITDYTVEHDEVALMNNMYVFTTIKLTVYSVNNTTVVT